MKNILKLKADDLLALVVEDIRNPLNAAEIIHMARILGAFWTYDYDAASEGRAGMHAFLKSGLHSDGFFVSRILLAPENIRRIIAKQMARKIRDAKIAEPDYTVGVPDGATLLGSVVAKELGTKEAILEKIDGRIVLRSEIPKGSTLLLVEDFCTRGTGFKETVVEIKTKQSLVKLAPYNPVIINRGGLKEISVEGIDTFAVLPLVNWRIRDWEPNECPLCKGGSEAVKPKATDESWLNLLTSQRPVS